MDLSAFSWPSPVNRMIASGSVHATHRKIEHSDSNRLSLTHFFNFELPHLHSQICGVDSSDRLRILIHS